MQNVPTRVGSSCQDEPFLLLLHTFGHRDATAQISYDRAPTLGEAFAPVETASLRSQAPLMPDEFLLGFKLGISRGDVEHGMVRNFKVDHGEGSSARNS